jgi:hypothetical protein
VSAVFAIHLHVKDLGLLKQIQFYFGVGNITLYETKGTALFSVSAPVCRACGQVPYKYLAIYLT